MDERAQAEAQVLAQLFEHPGWEVLARQTKERVEAFQAGCPFNINTVEQLYFAKGTIAALNELLSKPSQLAAFLEAAVEPESDT